MTWWSDFWHPVSQPFFYSLYHCDCDKRRPKDYWEVTKMDVITQKQKILNHLQRVADNLEALEPEDQWETTVDISIDDIRTAIEWIKENLS